jgi:hypothetical protein
MPNRAIEIHDSVLADVSFSRVKRSSISHRCIYTRVKVYRSVMLGVVGYRKRYFA